MGQCQREGPGLITGDSPRAGQGGGCPVVKGPLKRFQKRIVMNGFPSQKLWNWWGESGLWN